MKILCWPNSHERLSRIIYLCQQACPSNVIPIWKSKYFLEFFFYKTFLLHLLTTKTNNYIVCIQTCQLSLSILKFWRNRINDHTNFTVNMIIHRTIIAWIFIENFPYIPINSIVFSHILVCRRNVIQRLNMHFETVQDLL